MYFYHKAQAFILFVGFFCFCACTFSFNFLNFNGSILKGDTLKVAIYNDGYLTESSMRGVWDVGVNKFKEYFKNKGIQFEEIDFVILNSDNVKEELDNYKLIIFPGGFSKWYNYYLSRNAKVAIRSFVANGGSFLGICAGAYFASSNVEWYGENLDNQLELNQFGEMTGYDLYLFSGRATGAITEIADYYGKPKKAYTTITFDSDILTDDIDRNNIGRDNIKREVLYFGGPYFSFYQPVTQLDSQLDSQSDYQSESQLQNQSRIIARYQINQQPAIIAFPYDDGKVILSGVHPEVDKGNWPILTSLISWLME